MLLKDIHLLHFKSWTEGHFEFSSKLNCFTGPNGSGKTNLLDAIYYLCLTKSYFSSNDQQNIQEGADFFSLDGNFDKEGEQYRVQCALKRGQKKSFRKNKKEYDKLSDHIGQFPGVVISPYDRDLITDRSELRRRFMDNVISQSEGSYLHHLMRYNRALQQRNSLLKFFAANAQWDEERLSLYDHQLDEHAQEVYEFRQSFIREIEPLVQQFYAVISAGSEKATLHYSSKLKQARLRQLLDDNRAKDRVMQYTGVGTHRDNIEFRLNDKSVKHYGSQGQQKSYLIALKLAQHQYIKQKRGTNPLLLLDDIFDKLDEQRVAQLIELVNDQDFGQIFITDTHPERMEELVGSVDPAARIINTGHEKRQ